MFLAHFRIACCAKVEVAMSVALCPVCRLPCERTASARRARCQPCDIEFEAKVFVDDAEATRLSRRVFHAAEVEARSDSAVASSLARVQESSRERLRRRRSRIRVRCPYCSLLVVIRPKKFVAEDGNSDAESAELQNDDEAAENSELEAGALLLDEDEVEGRDTDTLRLRCPHCQRRVELQLRDKRKHESVVEAPMPIQSTLESTFHSDSASPAPVAESPRPPVAAPSRRTARKPVELEAAGASALGSIARELAFPATIFLASAALICSSFERVCVLVLPLAVLAGVTGLAALIATVRGRHDWPRPAMAAALGGVVFLMAAVFPGCLGSGYDAYRQPRANLEVTQIVSKKGGRVANQPTDPDGVDASLWALERRGVRVDVTRATHGPAEVRVAGGGRKTTAESYLIVWVSLRRASNGQEFSDNLRQGDSAGPGLKLALFEANGKELVKQSLDLGQDLAGQRRRSSMSAVVTIEDVAAFAPPTASFSQLRLEVSSAELGPDPVRFTIPKSMLTPMVRE